MKTINSSQQTITVTVFILFSMNLYWISPICCQKFGARHPAHIETLYYNFCIYAQGNGCQFLLRSPQLSVSMLLLLTASIDRVQIIFLHSIVIPNPRFWVGARRASHIGISIYVVILYMPGVWGSNFNLRIYFTVQVYTRMKKIIWSGTFLNP